MLLPSICFPKKRPFPLKDIISQLQNEDVSAILQHQPSNNPEKRNKKVSKRKKNQSKDLTRLRQLITHGFISKGFNKHFQVDMHQHFPDLKEKLISLHPPNQNGHEIPVPKAQAPIFITTNEVRQVIESSAKGKAPGLNGVTMEHLKHLIGNSNNTEGNNVLLGLRNLIQHLLNARLPQQIIDIITQGNLIPIPKDEDDPTKGIRPLVMADTLHKITARLLIKRHLGKIEAIFNPINQFGIGTKLGIDIIHHITNTNSAADPTKDIVAVDFKNAFQNVSRNMALIQCANLLPDMYPYIHQCYAKPTSIWFKDKNNWDSIKSSEGSRQGDPFGPLIFCLATLPLLKEIKETISKDTSILTYIDDTTIQGSTETVIKVLNTII
jgi:hypothetical protein